MRCYLFALLLPAVSAFVQNPSLSQTLYREIKSQPFHRDISVLASEEGDDQSQANVHIGAISNRRAFFNNVPPTLLAASMVFLPNEQANAKDDVPALFERPTFEAPKPAKKAPPKKKSASVKPKKKPTSKPKPKKRRNNAPALFEKPNFNAKKKPNKARARKKNSQVPSLIKPAPTVRRPVYDLPSNFQGDLYQPRAQVLRKKAYEEAAQRQAQDELARINALSDGDAYSIGVGEDQRSKLAGQLTGKKQYKVTKRGGSSNDTTGLGATAASLAFFLPIALILNPSSGKKPTATVARAQVRKPVVRKSVAKKPVVRKSVAKRPVARKSVAKKTVARKPVAKKPVARKPVVKKPVARKPVAKKQVARKPVAKKPVARKPVVKKPVARKPLAKKPVGTRQVARKTIIAKKPVAKKAVAKKPVAKKPIAKKPIAKKAVARKPFVAKKPIAKKPVVTKNPTVKKPVVKRSVVNKPVGTRTVRRSK